VKQVCCILFFSWLPSSGDCVWAVAFYRLLIRMDCHCDASFARRGNFHCTVHFEPLFLFDQVLLRLPTLLHHSRQRIQGVHDENASAVSLLFNKCQVIVTSYTQVFVMSYTQHTANPSRPPVIIGVTNPFFTKTLQHWPHILRVGDAATLTSRSSSPSLLSSDYSTLKKSSKLNAFDPKTGVYTKYKPFLKKDKMFMKALAKVSSGLSAAAADAFRMEGTGQQIKIPFCSSICKHNTTCYNLRSG